MAELICRKMQLGDYDASGRRSVVETEEIVKIAADTVIAAVGEKVPGAILRSKWYRCRRKEAVQLLTTTLWRPL